MLIYRKDLEAKLLDAETELSLNLALGKECYKKLFAAQYELTKYDRLKLAEK